jgi:hypothetical protein
LVGKTYTNSAAYSQQTASQGGAESESDETQTTHTLFASHTALTADTGDLKVNTFQTDNCVTSGLLCTVYVSYMNMIDVYMYLIMKLQDFDNDEIKR